MLSVSPSSLGTNWVLELIGTFRGKGLQQLKNLDVCTPFGECLFKITTVCKSKLNKRPLFTYQILFDLASKYQSIIQTLTRLEAIIILIFNEVKSVGIPDGASAW